MSEHYFVCAIFAHCVLTICVCDTIQCDPTLERAERERLGRVASSDTHTKGRRDMDTRAVVSVTEKYCGHRREVVRSLSTLYHMSSLR